MVIIEKSDSRQPGGCGHFIGQRSEVRQGKGPRAQADGDNGKEGWRYHNGILTNPDGGLS